MAVTKLLADAKTDTFAAKKIYVPSVEPVVSVTIVEALYFLSVPLASVNAI